MYEYRQYQHDAVIAGMTEPGIPILCSPTGSGKSYICALMAKQTLNAGETFGILTPREEILVQMADTIAEVCGHQNVGILKAGYEYHRDRPIQVISWPTLLSRTAKSEAWFPTLDRVGIDECHLSVSKKMSERILPYYKDRSKVFGVTATPARKTGKGLGSFFTSIKHVTSVRQLIKDGKLAPCDYYAGKLPDVSKLKTRLGDFEQKGLHDVTAELVGDVVDNWSRLAADRHTIVFAVDIAHCESLNEQFLKAGVRSASLHIHKTPERRRQIVESFKAGEIQVLVNVSICSYGFDAPSVDCIVLARPTKSIVMHLQMLGRGMRVHDGKTECMVLDHADNVRRLGQADDLYRWRLALNSKASENWTRDARSQDSKDGADKIHECRSCHHLFSRSLVCPKCGTEAPVRKRDVVTVDANLVRISHRHGTDKSDNWPNDRRFYLMLLYYGDAKGYSRKWAYWKFVERTGGNPEHAWQYGETIVPTVRVRNWIAAQLRKYARAKKKERTATGRGAQVTPMSASRVLQRDQRHAHL